MGPSYWWRPPTLPTDTEIQERLDSLTAEVALAGLAAAGAVQAEPITLTEEQAYAVVAGDFASGSGSGSTSAYVGPDGGSASGSGSASGYAVDTDGGVATSGADSGASASASPSSAAASGYGSGYGSTTP